MDLPEVLKKAPVVDITKCDLVAVIVKYVEDDKFYINDGQIWHPVDHTLPFFGFC